MDFHCSFEELVDPMFWRPQAIVKVREDSIEPPMSFAEFSDPLLLKSKLIGNDHDLEERVFVCRLTDGLTAEELEEFEGILARTSEDDDTIGTIDRYFVIRAAERELIERLFLRSSWEELEYACFDLVINPGTSEAENGPLTLADLSAETFDYFGMPPKGINVSPLWKADGSTGDRVTVAVIGVDCYLTHEFLQGRVNGSSKEFIEYTTIHGTETLSTLMTALGQSFALGGTVWRSSLKFVSMRDTNISDPTIDETWRALFRAIIGTQKGDIILFSNGDAPNSLINGSGANVDLPIEVKRPIFQLIKFAVRIGRIVIEPASNGATDLGQVLVLGTYTFPAPDYKMKEQLIPALAGATEFDSGAIIVGACMNPPALTRYNDSNFGKRVDCCARGDGVSAATRSRGGAGNPDDYTDAFLQTSSAAPQIAGLAAILQSVRLTSPANPKPIQPETMRGWFKTSPLVGGAEPVGGLPNAEDIRTVHLT